MIYVVGLGPGSETGLPPQAITLLSGELPVFFRTIRHPVLQSGPVANALQNKANAFSLDDEYETNASFADTYAAIVSRILREQAARGAIVYAVPGHPLVGESTVALLLPEARARGLDVKIVGAPSFVDACLEAVGEAITGNLTVVDALTLGENADLPSETLRGGKNGPLLLYQVYDQEAASIAKLALMRAGYPDEFPVTLVCAAGIPGQEKVVRDIPLYALDRTPALLHHLTSVWVPQIADADLKPNFTELLGVMARLRNQEGGCPWDLKQTHQSLRPYVLEEAYEVADAIDNLNAGDGPEKLADELGDLLLQVVFHAQIARQSGDFDESDVCKAIVGKLIRRHPHIFGDVSVAGADEVLTNWNAIKAREKGHETRVSVLDGVPHSAPALFRALQISKKAVGVGFEWPNFGGVLDKAEEEFNELRAELEAETTNKTRISAELGDLLFTLVNVARHLEIDPEAALREQITRFSRRFSHIEAGAKKRGVSVDTLTLSEMEHFWQEAKHLEKSAN